MPITYPKPNVVAHPWKSENPENQPSPTNRLSLSLVPIRPPPHDLINICHRRPRVIHLKPLFMLLPARRTLAAVHHPQPAPLQLDMDEPFDLVAVWHLAHHVAGAGRRHIGVVSDQRNVVSALALPLVQTSLHIVGAADLEKDLLILLLAAAAAPAATAGLIIVRSGVPIQCVAGRPPAGGRSRTGVGGEQGLGGLVGRCRGVGFGREPEDVNVASFVARGEALGEFLHQQGGCLGGGGVRDQGHDLRRLGNVGASWRGDT